MILVVDNYDSFTYNLVQRLGEVDPTIDIRTVRNDQMSIDDIRAMAPERIIISPGPCTPNEAGISLDIILQLQGMCRSLGCAWATSRLARRWEERSFGLPS